MSNRKKSTSPDYVVGYRRPPKAMQFKAGRSGNPNGRPKGRRPIGAVLHDIFEQRISVTENGKTYSRTVFEISLRGLAKDAMRGDARAIKLVLFLHDRYAESQQTTLPLRELLDEDAVILSQYLREPGNFTPKSPATPKDKRRLR
jgi:hypothetical protein